AGGADVLQLVAPEEPKMGKAVQKEDRLALAPGDVVHPALGEVCESVFQLSRRDGRDSLSRHASLAAWTSTRAPRSRQSRSRSAASPSTRTTASPTPSRRSGSDWTST